MTIPPQIFNDYVISQGADWIEAFSFTDEAGTIIDISAWVIVFLASTIRPDASPPINLSTTNGKIVIADNVATMKIPAATTVNIPAGTYFYNLNCTDSNGVISRRLQGTLCVSQEV